MRIHKQSHTYYILSDMLYGEMESSKNFPQARSGLLIIHYKVNAKKKCRAKNILVENEKKLNS